MEDETMGVAGDTSTQEILEVGGSVSSDITGDGDTDFFAITIEAGQTITFSQSDIVANSDLGFAREVTLQDSDGNIVASGPAGFRTRETTNVPFTFQAEETATFFLSIEGIEDFFSAEGNFGSGSYTLSATETFDDFSNFASDAAQLAAGDSETNGNIEYDGDVDVFTISLTQGDTIRATLDTDVFSNLTLMDSDGNIESSLATGFTADQTGDFTLIVASDFDINRDFRDSSDNAVTGDYNLQVTVTSGETINIPTELDDLIVGTSGDDRIFGLGGNDRIEGLAGDDFLQGNEGNDTLIGGEGENLLFGGDGDDRLIGGENGDVFRGDAGDDRIIGGAGNDQISGGSGSDTISGNGGSDSAIGGDGDDFISVGTLARSGSNFVLAGDGADTIVAGGGTDTIFGDAGDDIISSGAGNDFIDGGDGADVFSFNADDDHDTIADFEIGVDSLSIFISSDNFLVNFTDVIENGVLQDFTRIENLLSQDGNDTLVGLGADQSIRLLDTQLDDLLANEDSTPIPATPIRGGAGADTLIGTADNDLIFGEGDSDGIFGGAGDDIIDSGTGNDYLVGGDGADVFTFDEGDGHDTIADFEIGVDSISISIDSDSFIVDFTDVIENFVLQDFTSIENLLSQDGNDTLLGLGAEQSIRLLDTQLDDLLAGEAPSTPTPIEDPDEITGTSADDTLNGTAGNDVIFGEGGSDGIFAGAGDDIIDSGTGNDYLVGGAGADVFTFGEGDGHDTIADFEAALDAIEISGVRIDNLSDISERLSQDGNDVLIGISAEQSIRLINTTLEDVDDMTIEDGATDNVIIGTSGNDALAGGTGVDVTDFGFDDFGDFNLVENNNTVFLYLDEDTSVELTGIESVDELSVDDFVL